MSEKQPVLDLLVWNPQSPSSTSKVLDWLRTQPRKDIIGYVQIGQKKPHQITHRNRHTWEKVLFDFVSQDQQPIQGVSEKEGVKIIYLVEIIRYGNPSLGVHRYGVFDDFTKIAPTMAEYNSYRGGKYPAYFVTEFSEMNPSHTDFPERKRYEVTYVESE